LDPDGRAYNEMRNLFKLRDMLVHPKPEFIKDRGEDEEPRQARVRPSNLPIKEAERAVRAVAWVVSELVELSGGRIDGEWVEDPTFVVAYDPRTGRQYGRE